MCILWVPYAHHFQHVHGNSSELRRLEPAHTLESNFFAVLAAIVTSATGVARCCLPFQESIADRYQGTSHVMAGAGENSPQILSYQSWRSCILSRHNTGAEDEI